MIRIIMTRGHEPLSPTPISAEAPIATGNVVGQINSLVATPNFQKMEGMRLVPANLTPGDPLTIQGYTFSSDWNRDRNAAVRTISGPDGQGSITVIAQYAVSHAETMGQQIAETPSAVRVEIADIAANPSARRRTVFMELIDGNWQVTQPTYDNHGNIQDPEQVEDIVARTRQLLDNAQQIIASTAPEAGNHMSLEADPPRSMWGRVTIEELVDESVVRREIAVPFEQVEVDAILEARRIADEFITHGEHGTDNIARGFWGDVYGAGFVDENLFPRDESAWQNRPDAVYNLGQIRKAAQRARMLYEEVIENYPYAENLQKFRERKQMMQDIEDQLDRLILHEEQPNN